jgi:hypothetical protein
VIQTSGVMIMNPNPASYSDSEHRVLRKSRGVILTLAAIFLLALVVRVWGISFGLPQRYQVDESAYVLAALELGQGNYQMAYPPLSPNLHQILLMGLYATWFLFQLVTGTVDSPSAFAQQYKIDPSTFYLLTRGLTVFISLAGILMLFWLVRRLRGSATALVSVLFLALSFLDVRHAHFGEPYSLIALFCMAACVAAIQCSSTGKVRWIAVAGLASGIAIGLRYSVVSIALVPFLAVIHNTIQARANRRQWIHLLVRSSVVLFVSLFVGSIIGTPALVVNTSNALAASNTQLSLALTTEGFWGFQFTDWPTWRFYGTILEMAWGWPLLLAAAVGLAKAINRRKYEDLLMLIFPASFMVVLLLAPASSSAFARYLVPILPFAAYYAADGLVTILDRLANHWSASSRRFALALAAGLLIIVPAVRIVQLNRLWTKTDTRTLAKHWIEENIPEGSHIALQWHSPPLSTVDDYEPASQRTYAAKTIDPFSSDPELYSLDYYVRGAFDYVVMSSYIYRLQRVDPLENQQREAFYRSLDTEAQLVAEFKPTANNEEVPFMFEEIYSPFVSLWQRDRPGPTIKIYRILDSRK